jgi:DNA primase
MAKVYLTTVKYHVRIKFDIDGVVDKEDIIGAIFGQSEGLLGEEMDLKELQQSGKLGRIEVNYKSEFGKTHGDLLLPSSMNMPETTLLAATIESVEKVGPCDAKLEIVGISDVRKQKRNQIKERAKLLLDKLRKEQLPDTSELAEEVKESSRELEVKSHGRDKLACGPDIMKEDSIIVVEGRADVMTLLRSNIKNVIEMGGTKISSTISDLSKKKELTLFVDGDRGGELNARKLLQVADVDYIARAPAGKEVEELTRKEILLSLKRKMPAEGKDAPQARPAPRAGFERTPQRERPERKERGYPSAGGRGRAVSRAPSEGRRPSRFPSRGGPRRGPPSRGRPQRIMKPAEARVTDKQPATQVERDKFSGLLEKLKGSMKATFYNSKMEEILSTDVRNINEALDKAKGIYAVVFDGIISKRLAEAAEKNSVKYLVGIRKADIGEPKELRALVL